MRTEQFACIPNMGTQICCLRNWEIMNEKLKKLIEIPNI